MRAENARPPSAIGNKAPVELIGWSAAHGPRQQPGPRMGTSSKSAIFYRHG